MLQQQFIPQEYQSQAPKVKNGLSNEQQFGLMFEKWVAGELEARGHRAELLADFTAPYDIRLNDQLPVEVKAARPTQQRRGKSWRTRWQFDLTGGLDHLEEDHIFVLILIDEDGEIYPFIISSADVGSRRTICITSHPTKYEGWLKDSLNSWDTIDTVSAYHEKYNQIKNGQMVMF